MLSEKKVLKKCLKNYFTNILSKPLKKSGFPFKYLAKKHMKHLNLITFLNPFCFKYLMWGGPEARRNFTVPSRIYHSNTLFFTPRRYYTEKLGHDKNESLADSITSDALVNWLKWSDFRCTSRQRKQSPESDSQVLGEGGDHTVRTSPTLWGTAFCLCGHHKHPLQSSNPIFIQRGLIICPSSASPTRLSSLMPTICYLKCFPKS